jgi:hypothetical protein
MNKNVWPTVKGNRRPLAVRSLGGVTRQEVNLKALPTPVILFTCFLPRHLLAGAPFHSTHKKKKTPVCDHKASANSAHVLFRSRRNAAYINLQNRDSSVDMATGYGVGGQGSIHGKGIDFSLFHSV